MKVAVRGPVSCVGAGRVVFDFQVAGAIGRRRLAKTVDGWQCAYHPKQRTITIGTGEQQTLDAGWTITCRQGRAGINAALS